MGQDLTEKKATFVSKKKKLVHRVSPGKKFLHKQ